MSRIFQRLGDNLDTILIAPGGDLQFNTTAGRDMLRKDLAAENTVHIQLTDARFSAAAGMHQAVHSPRG